MRTLPSGWSDQINKLHGTSPFVWCWRIPLVYSPALVLYVGLTNHRTLLNPTGADYYYPWPLQASALDERSDGKLPELELTISNRPRILSPFFEDPGDATGMFGKRVLATVLNVDTPAQYWTFQYEIESVSLTDESASLRLSSPNYLQVRVPQERHNPSHCRWRFGSEECGYVINSFATYTTCPKTLTACEARGIDMQNRRLPKLQPQRFGGFVGIPRS